MIENELIGEKVISQHYGEGVIINTDLDCLVGNRKVVYNLQPKQISLVFLLLSRLSKHLTLMFKNLLLK